MLLLSRNGAQYQTKAMDHEQAYRFACCLRANPRFDGVMLYEEPRPRNPRKTHRVVYHPRNEARLAELLARAQGERTVRAVSEGHGYVFALETEKERPFWYCFNPKSGDVWEVCDLGCTCPDWEYRGRSAGLDCKHMVALKAGLGERLNALPEPIGACCAR